MSSRRAEPIHLEWFPPESFPDRDALCAFADSPESDGCAFLRGLRSVLRAHDTEESEGGLPATILADARQALCAIVADFEQLLPLIAASLRDPELEVVLREALAFEPATRQRLCAAVSQAVAFVEIDDSLVRRLLVWLARFSVGELVATRGAATPTPLRPRHPLPKREP